MKPMHTIAKAALLSLLLAVLPQGPAQAQDMPKPVMENVFFNVVWGSAFGATLGVAISVIAASDPSQPTDARGSAFSGATAGGLVGLGVALYLVYQGITFDPGSSTFGPVSQTPAPVPAHWVAAAPPITLLTSSRHPGRVTGFQARILDLKF